MNLLTIDLETTLNGNENVGKAHPMCKDNYAVYAGLRSSGVSRTYDLRLSGITLIGDFDFVVGHNISFDLMYLYRDKDNKKWLQEQRLWDTQLAEYLLSGQQIKWSSLDELCTKYGLELKDDKIKEYFNAGIGSESIPTEEIIPYLEHDLEVTEAIAQKQITQAISNNQLDLIISQMEALHATTEMMFNGLFIDGGAMHRYYNHVLLKCNALENDLERSVTGCIPTVNDINSPKQWSKFFFGGYDKVVVSEPIGMYKNGKVKYKKKEEKIKRDGHSKLIPATEWTSAKTGVVSVDDTVLKTIAARDPTPYVREVAETLLNYRYYIKCLSTYAEGLGKHIQDGYIHGKLNHTATVTGRLSSTSPNLQNISGNEIKAVFISRWSKEVGSIVELDFSQLEVVALAHVTRDKQLIEDISSGTDMHSELYKTMYGKYPTKEERKPFKSRSFQLIYGAGAKAIAQQAGISKDEAKKFIDVFYTRYPGVRAWHTSFAGKASLLGKNLPNDKGFDLFKTFVYTSETGRRYVFKEYKSEFEREWCDSDYSFSPTELKNYPVQGLATGDIVPMMLGIIFRKFVNNKRVKMINTIHDSVMFDVQDDALENFITEVSGVLNNTHKYYEETFGKPLALKLKAGVSVGKDWFNMIERK